jgi:hypothetical protein
VAKELDRRGVVPVIEPHRSVTYDMRERGVHLYVARRDVLKRELPKKASRDEVTQ